MSEGTPKQMILGDLQKSDFEIQNLEDESRVDKQCVQLIRRMLQDLTERGVCTPEEAGEYCHGADYFLREFIIAERNENLFRIDPVRVRQFAGHWYIVRTLEPNMVELKDILNGTAAFYRFLSEQGLISGETAAAIEKQCQDVDYYADRIKAFWEMDKDGYDAWRQACPL